MNHSDPQPGYPAPGPDPPGRPEAGAGALVVGAPGHRWHQVAGSVSGWLARHAHCPVIVVP